MEDLRVKQHITPHLQLHPETAAPEIDRQAAMETYAKEDSKLAEDVQIANGMQPFSLFSTAIPPQLEDPEQFFAECLERAHAELKPLMKSYNEEEDDSADAPWDLNRKEDDLLRQFMNAIKNQRKNNEDSGQLAIHSILRNQEVNKKLQTAMFALQDEIIERSKTCEKVQWVNTAFSAALLAGGIASFGIMVATGGAALPGIVVAWNGAASLGAGTSKIGKSYLDYENRKQTGEMIGIKETRELNGTKISESMNDMQRSMDQVSQNWEMLRKILRSVYEASRNTMN